jgi:hypothetical protein
MTQVPLAALGGGKRLHEVVICPGGADTGGEPKDGGTGHGLLLTGKGTADEDEESDGHNASYDSGTDRLGGIEGVTETG